MVESMTDLHRHELGYEFSSSTHSGRPGHSRLDIILRPVPTSNHFDPQQVFFVISDDEKIEHLTITYKGFQLNKYRVVAGLVRIKDRKGKVMFALTFGGELQIEVEEQKKICTIMSTAPILQFIRPTVVLFAEEAEIILAERRAEWGNNPHEFETRLATVEPLTLYAACLEYIIEKFKNFNLEEYMHLKHYLQVKLWTLHKEHGFSPPLHELI